MSTGPSENFKISRSMVNGPNEGVSPVVKKSTRRLRQYAANDEADGEHDAVKDGAMFGGTGWWHYERRSMT
jgi:hypothetical protein